MSDLMRNQFEEWAGNKSDKEIHQRGPRVGKYKNPVMQRSWEAWQASRECLVIELPKEENYVQSSETAMFFLLEDVRETIHAAGVKTI